MGQLWGSSTQLRHPSEQQNPPAARNDWEKSQLREIAGEQTHRSCKAAPNNFLCSVIFSRARFSATRCKPLRTALHHSATLRHSSETSQNSSEKLWGSSGVALSSSDTSQNSKPPSSSKQLWGSSKQLRNLSEHI